LTKQGNDIKLGYVGATCMPPSLTYRILGSPRAIHLAMMIRGSIARRMALGLPRMHLSMGQKS